MGDSTRPAQKHHRACAIWAASLVVFSFGLAHAAFPYAPLTETLVAPKSLPKTLDALISTERSEPGKEGINLSARLTQDSAYYAGSLEWTIKTLGGEVVYQGTEEEAEATLPAGNYEVISSYGNVTIDEAVTIEPETSLNISFILNAGGLRILPAASGGAMADSQTYIYAMNGDSTQRLTIVTTVPGEIIKLAAGTYKLDTVYAGDKQVTSYVTVKAGVLSAVEIALRQTP